MAKDQVVLMAGLNITMPAPHNAERYTELLKKVYRDKQIVSVRGVHGAALGSLYPLDKEDPQDGWAGEIYYFVQLNKNEPWFDVNSREEASEEDIRKISIPDNLKPHLTRFPFVFFPKKHRIYYQIRVGNSSFSPQSAKKFFDVLFLLPGIETYGTIEVTVIPEKDSVTSVLSIANLRHIKIELVRPNPDDHEEFERRFLERLERQGAGKLQFDLAAASGNTLTPDEETLALAEVAAENGYVRARGKTAAGEPVDRSTKNIPLIEREWYSPDVQTALGALINKARALIRR